MNHLTELQCAMYVDGALDTRTHDDVSAHITRCDRCHERVSGYRMEQQVIRDSILVEAPVTVPVETPKFSKPISLRGFALVNLGTGLALWCVQFLWKTVFGELVLAGLAQLTSIYLPGAYELVTSTALYFLMEGTTMIDAYLELVLTVLALLAAGLVAYRFRSSRSAVGLCAVLLATGLATTSQEASALEVRRGEAVVTIPANETIDDTILIAAETIIVDGDITGDLFTAARRIVINGSVTGNIVAFSDAVSVHGNVGGLLLSAASTITLDGTQVSGDLWAAADQVSILANAAVLSNATIASSLASIDGSVGRDLMSFSETVNISGSVGEDVEAFAEKVNLLDDARIGGNLRLRTENEERLQQSADSRVGGSVEFIGLPEDWQPTNRYLSGEFYLWQVVRLIAAFLAGVALLWLLPSLRFVSLESGFEGIKTAGIGLTSLFMLPVIMVIFAITVVGLPFSLVALCLWGLLLYFAKIVVASMIGVLAMRPADDEQFVMPLLVGLAFVFVAINIPAIGGTISFVMTIVGMGILTRQLWTELQDLRGWA